MSLSFHLLVAYSSDDVTTFLNDLITEIDIRNDEFIVKASRHGVSSLDVKCKASSLQNEIEIGGCNVAVQTKKDKFIHKLYIGYTQKFKIYANYHFSDYDIKLNITPQGGQNFVLKISRLAIRFPKASTDCKLSGKDEPEISIDLNINESIIIVKLILMNTYGYAKICYHTTYWIQFV
ncbi:hypothetical protein RF11_14076 [Thelohanellus kitauei]|uniref:Uncharacterized protein n=1 Tax=Thelohanellus kitauei TaxID=669202 RepID=A0A0C2MLC9_THEKT|nr:hypothetical protein RF11_14076 [Thelohanellus kitauei]